MCLPSFHSLSFETVVLVICSYIVNPLLPCFILFKIDYQTDNYCVREYGHSMHNAKLFGAVAKSTIMFIHYNLASHISWGNGCCYCCFQVDA